MDWKKRAKELVDAHWEYHDVLIPIFLTDPQKYYEAKKYWGKWYKAIGIHFYKHAVEDVEAGVISVDTTKLSGQDHRDS